MNTLMIILSLAQGTMTSQIVTEKFCISIQQQMEASNKFRKVECYNYDEKSSIKFNFEK